MTTWRSCIRAFLHLCIVCGTVCATPLSARAAERYALVVTGASGGEAYADKYTAWRSALVTALGERFDYKSDRVFVLADQAQDTVDGTLKATRANVQRVLTGLKARMNAGDQLLVVLIGHGTIVDGEDAKFNLVGPDLSAGEWAVLLAPIPGRLVFIDTTSASFPFLRRLTGRGRIVMTATDSAAQQDETILPEFLIKALSDPAADANKDGRVSMSEVFAYASGAVRQWYMERGQLPVERPQLDDPGSVARVTYLGPDARGKP